MGMNMTSKVYLKTNKRMVYVYDIKDKYEALALANILEGRLNKGKIKSTKIEAYKYFDSDSVYHIRQRNNGDWEIRTKF